MARKTIEDNRDTLALIDGICTRGGGQAIVVEFVGPTERDMNPRWRAMASGGTAIMVYQDDRHGPRENAIRAAVILCERMEWNPRELVMGGLPRGGYVFTFAPAPVEHATPKEHEIWKIDTAPGEWFYVEGMSRASGWFCFEASSRAEVERELGELGFTTEEIALRLSEVGA